MTDQPDRVTALRQAMARDGARGVWCRRELTPLVGPSTDHLVRQLRGGPPWRPTAGAALPRRAAAQAAA